MWGYTPKDGCKGVLLAWRAFHKEKDYLGLHGEAEKKHTSGALT